MLKRIYEKLTSREVLLYMVFGVLTTVIEILVFYVAIYFLDDSRAALANIPSFFLAAVFSFVTNKKIVFRSDRWHPTVVLREGTSFLVSRIASFFLEELGLTLSVSVLHLDEQEVWGISAIMIAKVVLSISVAVINYFMGKFLVFRHQKKDEKI